MLDDYDDYLTPLGAAYVLNVSLTTIYKLIRTQQLPAFKLGPKLWRIYKQSLVDYLQNVRHVYDL